MKSQQRARSVPRLGNLARIGRKTASAARVAGATAASKFTIKGQESRNAYAAQRRNWFCVASASETGSGSSTQNTRCPVPSPWKRINRVA